IFGEKDYQQLKIIQKMARDLHLEIEVIGLPIIREDDGLALSSRNAYLSKKEREQARALSEALGEIRMRFNQGQNDISDLIHEGREVLNKSLIYDIDYLEIRNGNTLEGKEKAKSGDLVAIAAKIGHTRLIDNIKL
ncbi:MAG: pantoate--beta-alanine ligase, partial [Deltaproteobacteria bacterium]|nr:pantoate--beta-alanine ligase [Deltaproteobacteria bacterium]